MAKLYDKNRKKLSVYLGKKKLKDTEYMPIIMEQFDNPSFRYSRGMISMSMRKIFER